MEKLLTFADFNNDMKSKDGFKAFTSSTKKNSSQTIGDLNCFMTGNELNYAFQQTVSSEYTFGSGDKLIDSFPSWPEMKKKVFFNPYNMVYIFYEIDESFLIQGAPNTAEITNSGTYVSFKSLEYDSIDVKLKIRAQPDFIDGSSPFYYNDKEYWGLGSDFSFNVGINNIGDSCDVLVFKGSDMVYIDDIDWFVYEKTINVRADGVSRKLYYSPEKYMKLRTSEGDVTLNNSASQLYTYI